MNSTTQATLFSSVSDMWSTPQVFFDKVNAVLKLELDVCATSENTKLPVCITPESNALLRSWGGFRCWMNPPYSEIAEWMAKARSEAKKPTTLVACLVPARTDTVWFQDAFKEAYAVYFIKGRLKFGDQKNSAPFPSALIILTGSEGRPFVTCWDWKKDAWAK